MKKLLYLLCMLYIKIYAWNVPEEGYEAEHAKVQPQFEHIVGSFSKSDVKASFDRIEAGLYGAHAPIAHVQLMDGVCHLRVPEKCLPAHVEKAQTFAQAIKVLNQAVGLPDFELLLSLDACFERPYHLHLANVPVFSVSKRSTNSQVLLFPRGIFEPNREKQFNQILSHQILLKERQPVLIWRLMTFDRATIGYEWRLGPTLPLLFLAKKHPERLDFGIPNHMRPFVGNKVTGLLRDIYKPPLKDCDYLNYRYLLALDQRSSPCLLERQLFLGGVILRAETEYEEWFTHHLKPYEHYVPVDALCEKIFKAMDWCEQNFEKAEQIAQNAQQLAKRELDDANVLRYFYSLLVTYAQLQQAGSVSSE